MANIKQFTAAEALSTEAAGVWDVQSAQTSDGSSTYHHDVSKYHNVIIDCSGTIDVLFDTAATTACSDANDLEIPGGVTSIKIPKGLGNTIYFHWKGDGSTTPVVRLIFT
jgi:hypothetical protein